MNMKFIILFFLTHFTCLLSQAKTEAFFPIGGQRAIFVIQNPTVGPQNDDAQILYEAMNVPPKNSITGPGKSITTKDKAFTLVCGIRNGGSLYTCSLIIQDSDHSRVLPLQQKAEFALQGEPAREMSTLFVQPSSGEFLFEASDSPFRLQGNDSEFHFSFEK